MGSLNIIVPKNSVRSWHLKVVSRLSALGHNIVLIKGTGEKNSYILAMLLQLEQQVFSLDRNNSIRTETVDPSIFETAREPVPDRMTIDLTGSAQNLPDNAIQLLINGGESFPDLAGSIAAGKLPELSMSRAGKTIARASPMIDNRVSIGRGLEDVLARAVSFSVATIQKVMDSTLETMDGKDVNTASSRTPFLASYIRRALPRLGCEVLRRQKYRSAHWKVGYRFIDGDGDGVARTGDLSGGAWSLLPDDSTHFFADPFPFIKDGMSFIFVEDWSHDREKAVISVSRIDRDGRAGKPQPVIESECHLSYPQLFSYRQDVWMIPESSAARNLVLYRATRFPDRWETHKILIRNRDLSDATLIEHGGVFWLFATDGDDGGSQSDMLVVFRADALEGPWLPHQANPISIHRSKARPGGAFIRDGNRIFLPVQDGSLGYGGGLGLSELTTLDNRTVRLSSPLPVRNNSDWPYPRIHTLNRSGRLEVIDGIARVRK